MNNIQGMSFLFIYKSNGVFEWVLVVGELIGDVQDEFMFFVCYNGFIYEVNLCLVFIIFVDFIIYEF